MDSISDWLSGKDCLQKDARCKLWSQANSASAGEVMLNGYMDRKIVSAFYPVALKVHQGQTYALPYESN